MPDTQSAAPLAMPVAMKELEDALMRLEEKLGTRLQDVKARLGAFEEVTISSAHLRREVSDLKKQLAAQSASGAKAEQQIDAALAQINIALGAAGSASDSVSDGAPDETGEPHG